MVPRSCWEIIRERRASWAEAPALRIMWASPRGMPKAEEELMRASMQVTIGNEWVKEGIMGVVRGLMSSQGMRGVFMLEYVGGTFQGLGRDLQTAYFFAGGRARWPCVKLSAYSLFFSMRFCWIGVVILGNFEDQARCRDERYAEMVRLLGIREIKVGEIHIKKIIRLL